MWVYLQFERVVEKALDDDETDGGGYSKEALPTEADFILAYATVPGSVSSHYLLLELM